MLLGTEGMDAPVDMTKGMDQLRDRDSVTELCSTESTRRHASVVIQEQVCAFCTARQAGVVIQKPGCGL